MMRTHWISNLSIVSHDSPVSPITLPSDKNENKHLGHTFVLRSAEFMRAEFIVGSLFRCWYSEWIFFLPWHLKYSLGS